MNATNRTEALRLWRQLLALNDRAEQLVLEIATHPGASLPQIAQARRPLMGIRAHLRRTYPLMEKAVGGNKLLAAIPKPRFMEPRKDNT